MKHALNLNEQQLYALEETIAVYKGLRAEKHVMIEGYAGTGKTFTIGCIIREILDLMKETNKESEIALTAPTNKAVKVLTSSATIKTSLVDYITIYKLLQIKAVVRENGKQEFVPDMFDTAESSHGVIVIDESSMLPDYLTEELMRRKDITCIFMGDPAQIPPVNNNDCIIMDEKKREKYGIKTIKLTQIMRQKNGNPIVELSFWIRNNLKQRRIPEHLLKHNIIDSPNGKIGYAVLKTTDQDDISKVMSALRIRFDSEKFSKNPDYAKVIAWTNSTVDYFNQEIREMIYKEKNLPKIMVGEKLLADEPILQQGKFARNFRNILWNTNDEFVVVSWEIKSIREIEDDPESDLYKIYETVVRGLRYDIRKEEWIDKEETIQILHEDDEPKFRSKLKRIEAAAKKHYFSDKQKAKQTWLLYYALKSRFASINYNYAITAHKSQGSTYECAFIMEYDISKNSDIVECNKIKYTAITRAKNFIYLVT